MLIRAFGAFLALTGAMFSASSTVAAQILDSAYDQVYWSRTHNTYDRSRIAKLTDTLHGGYRALEIDTHPTLSLPRWPGSPVGPTDVRFPVQHNPGPVPNPNNCNDGRSGDLSSCLRDVRAWINENPNREPITILLDIKGDWGSVTGSDVSRPDQLAVARQLNALIERELGPVLFRPRDLAVFQGQSPWAPSVNLRRGVMERGWPTVRALRGKVIVLMTGGSFVGAPPIYDMNDTLEEYVEATGWGVEANAFVCPIALVPSNFDWNNRAEDFDRNESNRWVVCGTVKGSADWSARTLAAERNRQLSNLWDLDGTDTTQAHLAIAYKSSLIQRDGSEWNGLALNGVRGSRPVAAMIEVKSWNGAGYEWLGRAGSFRHSWVGARRTQDIHTSWKFTEDRQIVSLNNESLCLDIQGAHNGVDPGDFVHLYECDGGRSERWRMNKEGQLYNDHDGLCLQASQINGRGFVVARCVGPGHSAFPWQRFNFRPLTH